MPASIHLLERAYQLIDANQLENAELVLDAVVRVEPRNAEAWKTYLQIHRNQNDLDWLKDRILKTKELSEADKTELVHYYLLLTQQLNGIEEAMAQAEIFNPPLHDEPFSTEDTTIRFELLDVFDYPTKLIQKETKTRSRQRAIYNTFASDIASGALKAMSHDPFGRKIATFIQKAITLMSTLVKNPKDMYVLFSKSPHFEKYFGIALLTLFVLGIRLLISNQNFGYAFLGMFVIGGGWWLVNFGSHSPTTLNGQVRVYLHENNNNLLVIKEKELENSNTENLEKTIE